MMGMVLLRSKGDRFFICRGVVRSPSWKLQSAIAQLKQKQPRIDVEKLPQSFGLFLADFYLFAELIFCFKPN
ncbi:MAG: hypothetical protein HC849_18555 [Oscillatoriales cyanobacterium RU_3_3]|nr:hypothetical protein [Oscillatoriales cyanobacterium RU_3_3]